jgi:hypothetical protein
MERDGQPGTRIEGSTQHLSLLQTCSHSQDGTRSEARAGPEAQGQRRAGWLPSNLLPLAPLLSETTDAQMQGPLAAVWLHERFDLHHGTRPPCRWEGRIAGESPLCPCVYFLPFFFFFFFLVMIRHVVTLGCSWAWMPTAARHSSRRLALALAAGGKCNACHVPIWGLILCRLFYFTSHAAHRRRFVSLFRISWWMGMACLSP